MYKPALIAGIIFAALAVILGAFAAHGLRESHSPEQIAVWQTGVTYQFYHAIALIICAILWASHPFKTTVIAARLFAFGILFFSGSLYFLSTVFWQRKLGLAGLVTPLGGVLFIGGWVSLLLSAIKKK